MVIKRSGAIISVLLIFILSIFVPNYVYSQQDWEFSSRFELLLPSQSFREFLNTNGNLEGTNLGYIPSIHDFSYLKGFKPKAAEINSYPSSFDLRTQGKLSPVKNQGPYGTCWAFATYGSLESSLLPEESWDFSEDNMVNLHGFDLGYNDGGNYDMATAYFVRWSGPVNESDDPYSDHWSPQGLPPQKHVQEVLYFPPRSGPGDNDTIKWALTTYGGVGTSIYWDDSCYNSTYKSYYYSGTATVNHAVVIVGWDDNYDKARFSGASGTPPGNGAFIVRNSWGSSWGEGGYFYVSYYDSRIGSDNVVFNNAEPVTNYGKIYQYDTLGWTTSGSFGSQTGWFAAVFQATSTETISAVAFYSATLNSLYEVYVQPSYNGSNLKGSLVASGTLSLPGFHTVSFAPQPIPPGNFSVVVKLTTPGYYFPIPVEYPFSGYSSTATALPGQTFVSSDGSSWQDLNSIWPNSSVCLKAYAQASSQPSPSLSFTPSSFTFTATQGGGNPPSQTLEVWNSGGGSMSWTVSKDALWLTLSPTSGNSSGEHDQITVSVDTSGLASGTYTATITLSGEGASNSPQYIPVTLQVNPPKVLNSLSINPSSWIFTTSTPKQFQATAYFSDGSSQDVTSSSSWSSDNSSIASVNSSGLVTPISNGSTYIRASYTYNGETKTAQSSVSVNFPHIVSITSGPSASPSTIASGGTTSLSVSASDSLGHSLTYSWSVLSSSIGSGTFSNPNLQNPTWTAPQNLTGVNQTVTLKVKASCSLDPTKYAEGTVSVTVLPLPSLTLTSPNGGESWIIGSTQNITWTSTGLTGNVKIELNRSYPTGSWETLFASTPNDGNESWQVSGSSSSSCRLRLTSLSNPSVSDISDNNFSILSPPSLSFAPTSFTFTATQGGSNPPLQALEVWNSGGGSLNWAASKNATWLSLSPTSGISSGEHDSITVSVNISGLSAGTYTATITLTGEGASNSPQYIPVTLQVLPQSLSISNLTATPSLDIATFNPVHLQATSPAPGNWSVRVFNPLGIEVTSYGSLVFQTTNPTTNFSCSWTPTSSYQIPGNHYALISLSDGTLTRSATVSFSLYNFPVKITEVKLFNALWQEITNPKANQPFYVQVTIANWSPYGPVIPKAFIPIQITGSGFSTLGITFSLNLAPGGTAGGGAQFKLTAGTYDLMIFVWDDAGGAPITLPFRLSLQVLP